MHYNLQCNDNFFLLHLDLLLKQKNLPEFNEITSRIKINIHLSKKKINLNFDSLEETINLPVNFNLIFNSLLNKLSQTYISFNEIIFFPFRGEVKFGQKKTILRNNHSLIFQELIRAQNNGIKKTNLYSIIWPNDYNIQINKLDTHLTNLKNFLKSEINYELNYLSQSGIIKINSN